MSVLLRTERLLLREWTLDDAEAAFAIYGDPEVARWLTPQMEQVSDVGHMREILATWIDEQQRCDPPLGRWAIVLNQANQQIVIGSLVLRTMPPYHEDVEIAWQLARPYWGRGYATEAARALARWAFSNGAPEVFAVVRPENERAIALSKRLGMEWVGETDKYYNVHLQVYRLRPSDLA